MENQQQQQLAKRITEANYILVTVNSNPTFDQLAAAIGLTLMINKMNKYATAIFSGQIPSSLNFLNPEKTIEKTTDSLRDFIISLDKDKADKLRYKIEDNFVRIFISPYHSALSEKDFVYTMGDFNVDVVVALGITKREELDKVIIEQGRILHDATIATINTSTPSTLGTINWDNSKASSLCEMLVSLSSDFKVDKLIDGQIANSLLSGIIEETAQFSNDKTTSDTMSAGSKLLGAGANQQLVSKEVLNNNPPSPSIQTTVVTKPPKIEEEPPVDKPTVDAFKITHPAEPELAEIPAPVVEQPVPELEIAKPPENLPPQSPLIKTEKDNITPDQEMATVAEATSVGETDFEKPNNSEDVEQIAIAPTMNTPMMTHRSVVMGQSSPRTVLAPPSTSEPELTVPPIAPPVEVVSPTSLKPVEALNAQPIDLTKDNTVEAPGLDHTPPSANGIDYGAGSNIEFSDPSLPPPVPPPIITK